MTLVAALACLVLGVVVVVVAHDDRVRHHPEHLLQKRPPAGPRLLRPVLEGSGLGAPTDPGPRPNGGSRAARGGLEKSGRVSAMVGRGGWSTVRAEEKVREGRRRVGRGSTATPLGSQERRRREFGPNISTGSFRSSGPPVLNPNHAPSGPKGTRGLSDGRRDRVASPDPGPSLGPWTTASVRAATRDRVSGPAVREGRAAAPGEGEGAALSGRGRTRFRPEGTRGGREPKQRGLW